MPTSYSSVATSLALLFTLGSMLLSASNAFSVNAGDDMTVQFPWDAVQLSASVEFAASEFSSSFPSVLREAQTVSSADCATVRNSYEFEYYIPSTPYRRMPLVIATAPWSGIESKAKGHADKHGIALISIVGLNNWSGYQGGYGSSRLAGHVTPFFNTWGVDVATCVIRKVEQEQGINFSGWYSWGHSGSAQFAQKMAFYKETSNGYNVPEMIKAYWSSAPGHPLYPGYDDIALRHRQRHQFHQHQVGNQDTRLNSIQTFAELMGADPNFYGRVQFQMYNGDHSSPSKKIVFNQMYEYMASVMNLNDAFNPIHVSWEKVTGRSVVFEGGVNTLNPKVVFTGGAGTYTFRCTATDGITGHSTVTDDVRVVVEAVAGANSAKPVLSVFVGKASASVDDSDPGHFVVRSSKKITGSDLAVLFDVTNANQVETSTEQLYRAQVTDYAGGDWSNLRYQYVPYTSVSEHIVQGTDEFFLMVHGKGSAASVTMTLRESSQYAIDPSMGSATINVQAQAQNVVKSAISMGGPVEISVDSQACPKMAGCAIEITSQPSHGTLSFGHFANANQPFARGLYRPNANTRCLDVIEYRVKQNNNVVSSGTVQVAFGAVTGQNCGDGIDNGLPFDGEDPSEDEPSASPCTGIMKKKQCKKFKVDNRKVCKWKRRQCIDK